MGKSYKTIGEALQYAIDQIKEIGGIPAMLALLMLEQVQKNLEAGKTISDEIEM